MKVIIESPFKNEDPIVRAENMIYLNCLARVLTTECSANPLFFHSFFTQFLDDDNSLERGLGLVSSFEYHDSVKTRVISIDRGISTGMQHGMERGLENGASPVFFSLDPDLEDKLAAINAIADPRQRWEVGLAKVNEHILLAPNEFGDRTNYRKSPHYKATHASVTEIMTRFFAPLVNYLSPNP